MQDALAESAQGWDDLVTDLEDRVQEARPRPTPAVRTPRPTVR